jgi:multidrug resistance efflux pump
VGDPAEVKLMGYSQIVRGHVDSIARGINVANAEPKSRKARQRQPDLHLGSTCSADPGAHPHIDEVLKGVVLAAGMTATVQIDPQLRTPEN